MLRFLPILIGMNTLQLEKTVDLNLTRAEARELFARLMLSHDYDNDLSTGLMKRLARLLETPDSGISERRS